MTEQFWMWLIGGIFTGITAMWLFFQFIFKNLLKEKNELIKKTERLEIEKDTKIEELRKEFQEKIDSQNRHILHLEKTVNRLELEIQVKSKDLDTLTLNNQNLQKILIELQKKK